jgi:hypothetical protein
LIFRLALLLLGLLGAATLPFSLGLLPGEFLAFALFGRKTFAVRALGSFSLIGEDRLALGKQYLAVPAAHVRVGERGVAGNMVAAMAGAPVRHELLIQPFQLSALLTLELELLLAIDLLLSALQKEVENLLTALRGGRGRKGKTGCNNKKNQPDHDSPPCNEDKNGGDLRSVSR